MTIENYAAKKGTTLSARRAEIDAAPFPKIRDLAVNVYKKPDGTGIMAYIESLGADHAVTKDKVIEYELAQGLLVPDGSTGAVAGQLAAPPPTPITPIMPEVAAPPKTPVPAQTQPVAAAPVNGAPALRQSRRSQQKGGMAAPPDAPPVQLSIPGSSKEETAAPPRTPVAPSNGFTAPVPQSNGFTAPVAVDPTPTQFSFVPPVPSSFTTSVQTNGAAHQAPTANFDIGPILQGIESLSRGVEAAVKTGDKALHKVTDLDAKTDHMMTILWYICQSTGFNTNLINNKIDSLTKFKQYAQFLSNPQ